MYVANYNYGKTIIMLKDFVI